MASKQLVAFEQKHTDGGMKDLRFTIAFADNRRTPLFRGNELRMLETFDSMVTVAEAVLAEGENDLGYYEVGLDVLACDCGDGLKCDKAKVTPYE